VRISPSVTRTNFDFHPPLVVVSLWRSKTGLTEVDQVVLHVIAITWESAALPSISMLVAVALYHGDPVSLMSSSD